ncbi:hypothetical protein HMPREF2619_00360 [Streptococcus sp. HMSC074B11]|uniref:hypothetical protein n=1 Tax=Streptococcus sp. HMSC074B11 TaxID=1715098 RepID=UPI0008A27F1B|nr:hypothetical protein [Streptococcus sp. HMSC074B11]OFN96737.1 hypothetical protein HMPREF2619_00360 [Streptococcus sp. HMSC074B11]
MEDKHERFLRLAESRTNTVIQKIHLIGDLANRSNYDYNEDEVSEIFKAIELEIQRTKKMFEVEFIKKDNRFSFSKNKK